MTTSQTNSENSVSLRFGKPVHAVIISNVIGWSTHALTRLFGHGPESIIYTGKENPIWGGDVGALFRIATQSGLTDMAVKPLGADKFEAEGYYDGIVVYNDRHPRWDGRNEPVVEEVRRAGGPQVLAIAVALAIQACEFTTVEIVTGRD